MNLIIAAAALPPAEARAIIRVMCRQGSPQLRGLSKSQKRFKSHLVRVLNFAKHETLRKLHRYYYSHRTLKGQDHPGATRIAFDPAELRQDLQSMLYSEMPDMMDSAATSTVENLGAEPFAMPSQDVMDFISRRASLLEGLPDELYQRISSSLSQGMLAGESMSQLSDRITQEFSDIESGQADVIASTESAAAFNYATDKAARSAGATHKQWIHGFSRVPRFDHLAINGIIVPMDEPYPVGSPPLMYPHAPNGSPEDVVNCSCVSIPLLGDENA